MSLDAVVIIKEVRGPNIIYVPHISIYLLINAYNTLFFVAQLPDASGFQIAHFICWLNCFDLSECLLLLGIHHQLIILIGQIDFQLLLLLCTLINFGLLFRLAKYLRMHFFHFFIFRHLIRPEGFSFNEIFVNKKFSSRVT